MNYDRIIDLIPEDSKNTAQQDLQFGITVLHAAAKSYPFLEERDLPQVLYPFALDGISEAELHKLMLIVRSVELHMIQTLSQ